MDVLGHLVNIGHQRHRVLKRVRIHALHQIRLDLRHAGAVVADIIHLIGVVDIAHLDLLVGEKRPRNAKCLSNFQELSRRARIHRFLLCCH